MNTNRRQVRRETGQGKREEAKVHGNTKHQGERQKRLKKHSRGTRKEKKMMHG